MRLEDLSDREEVIRAERRSHQNTLFTCVLWSFLRSQSYEPARLRHTARIIHFVLKSGGFEILAVPGTTGFRERILQIFGKDLLDQLVEYQKEYGRWLAVHLFTSRPARSKVQPELHVFLHQSKARADKIILHAISEVYRNILPSGTSRSSFRSRRSLMKMLMPNVHPVKTEVGFKHPRSSTI